MLEIKDGRVYVDDKETVDPLFIGYTILDAAENQPENVKTVFKKPSVPEIGNFFNIEDIIYLKHDIEQLPRMIIEVVLRKHDIMYGLQCGPEMTYHSDYEMSKEKTIY